jgi:hypothetical protein
MLPHLASVGRRVVRRSWHLLLGCVAYAHLPLAWWRRGRGFVRAAHAGGRSLEGAAKVALIVHFDRAGAMHDYLLFYLGSRSRDTRVESVSRSKSLRRTDFGRVSMPRRGSRPPR